MNSLPALTLAAIMMFFATVATQAADHAESPGAIADRPADLADIFFFDPPDTTGRIVAMITYGGSPTTADQNDADFYCDRDVLYSFFIDRDDNGDGSASVEPDVRIDIRMTQQASGACTVLLENVPGAGATFFGTVAGSNRIFQSSSGLNAFVGSTDDPFFFDSQGFRETTSTGTVSFDSTRDTFSHRNLSAIAFEIDTASLSNSNTVFKAWATTARIVE